MTMSDRSRRPTATPLDLRIDRSSPIPLYVQLATAIEAEIQSGRLLPGERIESELILVERLSLSRPTVRQAIETLVDRGLLVRRRGVGTQVVHGVTRSVELTSLWEDLAASGRRPTTRVIHHGVEAAHGAPATSLGVEEGSRLLRIRRIRFADDVPIAILENFLPRRYSDITSTELEHRGLYEILRDRGVEIRVARQRIAARPATAVEAKLLGVRRPSALLTMERTAYDGSGSIVEFGSHCYRHDLYAFEVTLVGK